jgi:hypothetical protein
LSVFLACITQREIVRDAARLYADVYSELAHRGAGGQVLCNDDTTIKVLKLEDPKRRKERVGGMARSSKLTQLE